MSTTVQNILDRAVAWGTANGLQSLTSDTAEVIHRVAADEAALYALAAGENSYYFAVETAVTSSSGSEGRTITTSGLSPLVGRVLRLDLASGDEAHQVDLRDLEAELAPRYYVLGTTLVEVENDWSAVSGTVSGTLTYVRRPATLNPLGALSQTVTLPDEFTDLLDLRLAFYLCHKDTGRAGDEVQRLSALIAERTESFLAAIQTFGGTEARRYTLSSRGAKR